MIIFVRYLFGYGRNLIALILVVSKISLMDLIITGPRGRDMSIFVTLILIFYLDLCVAIVPVISHGIPASTSLI